MSQGFAPRANTIARLILSGLVIVPVTIVGLGYALARSDYVMGQNRTVEQPVPFSHAHHSGEIEIDCRYCHTSVAVSAKVGLPPTTTCMPCHSQVWTQARQSAPLTMDWCLSCHRDPIPH